MLNISSNLYKSEWLDLVFKNRNKNYGAYALRAESAGNTLRALFIAAPIFVVAFAGPMIYKRMNPVAETTVAEDVPVVIADLKPPIHEMKKPVEQPMPKAEPLSKKIKTVALPSKPVVVKDELVTKEPPTLEEVKNAAIGPITQEGLETDIAVAPALGNGSGTRAGSATGGEGTVVDNGVHDLNGVEVFPEFEGGMKAWAKFIQRNLRYPEAAQESGLQGKVFISFVVEKDGSVSNVTLIRGIGGGCDEEALRVIRKSPKWKPGRQNNQSVRVRYQMPLSFAITQ